ncbi:PREDICTED: uncharacterized protein LOC108567299 [Nicrophorus vespilloides]|uniref:Uncharacterized protein LOC108567299 n=1 Tax=Nicrophorus vespilloides TaxID=110193 RepID=A0ABM1N8L0_NICVS|nr:PREDICTED: uncharacterized protein LOC108567299 [Nicrophorus vespilloides]
MFRQLFALFALSAALCAAYPAADTTLDTVVYNEKGEAFLMIPTEECRLARMKRDSDHNIKHKTYGYNDPKKGDVLGAKGIYTHKPSQSKVGVDAEKQQRGNSHAKVSGKTQYETEDGNGRVSVGANVNKQWNNRGKSHTGYGWEVEGDWDF